MMPEEPEHGYDLTQVMEPQDVEAALNFSQNMSPEMQQTALAFEHAFKQMDPQQKEMLMASMHRVLDQFRGDLGQVLPTFNEGAPGPVRKLIPILIGAVFAADAVLQSQGQKQSLIGNAFASVGNAIFSDKALLDADGNPTYDEQGNPMMEPRFGEPNWEDSFEFDGGFGNETSLINPFTGQAIDTIEDPAWYENLGYGLASGAMSFVNPLTAAGSLGRGASRLAGKGGAKAQIAGGKALANNPIARHGTRRAQDKAGKKALSDMSDEDFLINMGAAGPVSAARQGAKGRMATRGQELQQQGAQRLDDLGAEHLKATAKTGGAGKGAKVNRLAGATGSRTGKYGLGLTNLGYRGFQAHGRTPSPYGIDDALVGLNLNFGMEPPSIGSMDGSVASNTSHGMSTAATGGQAGGMGHGYGMGNVTNVDSNLGARREIWNPHADYASTRGQMLAGRGHDAGAFRGLGTIATGENMKIGERMLKEAQEKMYKDDDCCPNCGEKVGKMGCMKMGCGGMNKADDKKKPAHGMVIVIGSKAGPGPSKDGKREKLDSEKDKKDE